MEFCESAVMLYESQQDQSWFSARNLVVIQNELKMFTDVAKALRETMNIHQVSAPEVFKSEAIDELRSSIDALLKDNTAMSECSAVVELMKFKGHML